MANSKNESQDLMEAIRILLRTTEELKTAIPPLLRGQEDAFKILKQHEEAITRLMEELIGTQEDHKERLKTLELLKSRISGVEATQRTHESLTELIEERLRKVELEPIDQIFEKIGEEKVSIDDLRVVENALSLHPDDEYVFFVKALVLDDMGQKQEVLEFIEEAISRLPESGWLWYLKGAFLENVDESFKSYDKALELLKDGPPGIRHLIFFDRAALYARGKRFEEALESATKSVELNPQCAGGWALKGILLGELGRIPEALGCIEKAIELDSDLDVAWFQKGVTLSALDPTHADEAISCYDKTIELNPKFAEAYFNKGKLLYIEKKDYEKALATLDKGLEIDNKQPCGWCDRGVVLNRLGRNEEALESFKKTLELGPPKKCYQAFENMAIVLRNLERQKEAIEMLDEIAKEPKVLDEFRPHSLNTYAYLLYENTKRYEEGAEMARKAVNVEPQNAEFWDTLACNLQALGDDEKALEAFNKALSLKKDDREITWDALAKLYERLGRAKEAEQAYQKSKSIEESKQ